MKFFHRNVAKTISWQTYKELELIPASLPNPNTDRAFSTLGLGKAWRLLIDALTEELVYTDQQVEYLERCWAINGLEPDNSTDPNKLQQLWTLMN